MLGETVCSLHTKCGRACTLIRNRVAAVPLTQRCALHRCCCCCCCCGGGCRDYLLFFGGSIRYQQPEYSGGSRQEFHKHLVKPDEGKNATDPTRLYPVSAYR
jgi:hypothetical protein